MGRTQRALTSLVAAIPAGFLAYLLVMAFLNSADTLSTILKVVVGLTLACAALVTIMPFGLLIFGGKKAAAETEPAATASAGEPEDENEDLAVADVEVSEEAIEEEVDDFDIEDSDADVMADSDDEITGPASSLDEIETADFEDEEDEPAPKKRKKK